MGFSTQWEEVYRQGGQNSIWPWSDLVSYVMRYASPNDHSRVLELGFGVGANIPFFVRAGASYSGTEGSATAVERVRRLFADTESFQVVCCDFTVDIPFAGPFDLVVDRSSLTHNGTKAIRSCLQRLRRILRPGGKFIGIDWFSADHADIVLGTALEDRYTYSGFRTGQFAGVGTVHFADEEHMRELLVGAGFVLERLEHKRNDTLVPVEEGAKAWWNFVAVNP